MSSIRNLSGLNLGATRNLSGLSQDNITAEVPIIIDQRNITYDISTLGLATLNLTDNIFVQQGSNLKKTTLTDIKTLIDTNTEYTATSPLLLTGTAFSIDQSLFNLTTTMDDNDEIILFDTNDNFDKILFSNFRSAITTTANNFGTSSSGDISIGNTTHATTIFGVNTILNSEERSIITFIPASNTFNIGNSTDKTRLAVPYFYGSSGTNKRLVILDTSLNNEISINTPSLSADITLTMPNATGTLALFSEIPTNNNQLSNGRGFITASSTDTLTNKSMSYSQLTGTPTIPTIPTATAPIVLTGGSYTLPATSFTTIIEVPNTNLILMVDTGNSYKKVSVDNFVQLYQDTINYNADLPLVKDTTNDKYTFSLSGLSAPAQSQVADQMIMLMGVAGFNTFRKMSGLQLQQYITNEGVNFGTDITDTNDRIFGNSSRDSQYNGKTTYIQSQGVDRISVSGEIASMPRSAAELRVAHNTDTNNMSSVNTTSHISSIHDLHLFSPGQQFAGSLNRLVFIAGQSQAITAIMGYAGSSIAVSNGGIPDPTNSNNPMGSSFIMTQGTGNTFAVCNRLSNDFSTTYTQFTILNQDTNFWTDNVIINGGSSTEAILKLNSNNGAIHASNVGQILAYNTATSLVQLGSSFNDAEAKGNIFYVKQLRVSNFINSGAGDLRLAVNGSNRILISYSNNSYVLIGEKAGSASPTPEAAVHICNVGTTTNSQNARLRIESRVNTLDPVLEFVANIGVDSASRQFTYIYADDNGDMRFTLGNLNKSIITMGNATFERPIKNTYTGTSFGSTQAGLSAFPPVSQYLFQTSTTVGQGYLVNTTYRVPSSTEKYWSCWQLELTNSHNILGWGTHTGSGTFNQRFYVRSDGNFWGGSNLNTSDRRIKKDITNADGQECINILKSIKLKKYRYNDDWAEQHSIENSNYVYGFIAQDIGANPQLFYACDNKTAPITIDGEDITDINTIDKAKILTVLWGVCDKQQQEIEKQQIEIETLKSEIENIKTHLNL